MSFPVRPTCAPPAFSFFFLNDPAPPEFYPLPHPDALPIFPRDYDMEIIRERVRTRGHLLDSFPGLGLKAYLARTGGPGHAYAPFYLWHDPTAMAEFLWGEIGRAHV